MKKNGKCIPQAVTLTGFAFLPHSVFERFL